MADSEEDVDFRRRTLERVCAASAVVTVVFVLSGVMLVASLLLFFVADISRGSAVIALVDAAISGALVAASFTVLRLCNRLGTGG